MRSFVLPIAVLAAGAVAQAPECADGLYVVVARGTGEEEGTGVTGLIADAIVDQIEDSRVEAVDYPATFSDPDYFTSEKEGADAVQELLTEYYEACPDGKIAYLGYSQGGQIASDAFCGGAGDGFSEVDPLPTELVDNSVVAIVLFGDPSHRANTTYDFGTSINDGIFARDDVSVCVDYSDIMRSYCDTGDTYCDGGNVRAVHSSYVEKYADEVIEFVVKQYRDSQESGSASGTSTATSATSTATGTSTETGSPTTTASGADATSEAPSGTASPSSVPDNAATGLVPGFAAAVAVPMVMAALQLLG